MDAFFRLEQRADVIVGCRNRGQRKHTVQAGDAAGCFEHFRGKGANALANLFINAQLHLVNLGFGVQHEGFVFL